MSAPQTVRAKVRQELTRQILEAARVRLATDGAAALSLRSIARDLQMAPSALYRYFDGRDALLHALILNAYQSLADRAAAAEAAGRPGRTERERWGDVPWAMRAWALANPAEWGLIFGSPVPGYQAPHDTVVPYTRLAGALAQPVIGAWSAGRLPPVPPGSAEPSALDAALAPVTEALAPGLPAPLAAGVIQSWATVIGTISLEVFGHWRNTVLDPALLFEEVLGRLAGQLGLGDGPG